MWRHYFATKIQNAYRKYLKVERDSVNHCKIKVKVIVRLRNGELSMKKRGVEVGCPLDPIYREAYKESKRFRLVEWNGRKASVWHFNINTLVDWLNVSKKWINPLTNCLFMNRSIDRILLYLERNGIGRLKIKPIYNENEKPVVIKVKKLLGNSKEILKMEKYIEEGDEKGFEDYLKKNYWKIESDMINLNESLLKEIYVEEIGEKLGKLGLLHLVVLRGNMEMLVSLLYYGVSLEKRTREGYTAFHLSGMLGNGEVGRLLRMYGANVESMCKFRGKDVDILGICEEMGDYKFMENLLV